MFFLENHGVLTGVRSLLILREMASALHSERDAVAIAREGFVIQAVFILYF